MDVRTDDSRVARYTSATATTPVGYAVYVKTDDRSANGANWYWYERVPLDSEAPHDGDGIVADGKGGSGTALTICVGCHAGAGSDIAVDDRSSRAAADALKW